MEELFTRHEAAAKLRVSTKTLDKHVAAGTLRYVWIGHGRRHVRRMFAPSDLEAFIENANAKGRSTVSVKKPTNSPYYRFAFEYRGHRFHGSTKATSKRAAEEVERNKREKRGEDRRGQSRLDIA